LTRQWSVAQLSAPRWSVAAAAVGGRALFAGGRAGDSVSDAVDIYDSATGQWSTARLSAARQGATTAVVGSRVLFVGGGGASDTRHAIDVYDTDTGQWSAPQAGALPLTVGSATVGSQVVFIGSTTEFVDTLLVYDAPSGEWRTVPLAAPRGLLRVVA